MPSAELLYGKAIAILDTMPGKQEAPLYSNRSMVRLNLNKAEEALADANKCLEVDPKFVKAYHRKATALTRLNEWDDAIAAAEEGRKLEPDNKSWAEIVEKAEKLKEQDGADKAKLKSDAQDVRVELHNASTARAPPKKEPKTQGEESGMRGYKKTADGRTTSYFHTDISDEAKRLIAEQGFGKPQKLENPQEVEQANVKGGGSQWNQAGTYEEKGMTKWIEEQLHSKVAGVNFPIPAGFGDLPGGVIRCSSVGSIKGDASISVSRGKRRHLLDMSFDVNFEAKFGATSDVTGKGQLSFSEVNPDGDDPEVEMKVDSNVAPAVREVFNAFVKPGGQGLQPLVVKEIRAIIEEYKGK